LSGALRVRGAVFDLDGTLLDSMPLWMRAGEIYLASLGVEAEPGLGEKLFSMTVPESDAYLARAYPLHLSETEIADGINATVRDFYLKTAQLKPGAADFLQGLSQSAAYASPSPR
jgi:beta-phosphoglucomutase-like phosphatase (HAD superfamily)